MGQTVYVDLFFMINFSMDFLCFFLTCELLGTKLSVGRMLLASGLGGIYAVVCVFLSIGGILEIFIDLAACAVICLIAFGIRASPIVHIFVYVAVSVTLGGFMTALFTLLNRLDLPLSDIEADGISAYVLLLLAALSAVITLFGGKLFRRRSARKYTDVTVVLENKEKTLHAFCDSGNLLRDPISGRCCIIVDVKALDGVLDKSVIKAVAHGLEDTLGLPEELLHRVRLIPTVTVTGNGMTLAFRPDKIFIGEGKAKREVNALIALCKLEKNQDSCEALVPTELIF